MNKLSRGIHRRLRPATMAVAVAVAAASGGGSAAAQEDRRFHIAPMASYVLSDDDRHADDGIGGTLAFGTRLGPSSEIELRGTFLDYKGDDGTADVDIAGVGLGVNVFLRGSAGPYLHGDVMGGDETLFNIGLGWDLPLGDYFGIRAEALYHHQSNGSVEADEYKEPLFNLGVRIPLGKAPEPPPPPPAPAPVVVPPPPPPPVCSDGLDNDGDGLVDHPADKGCETPDDGDETDPAPKCAPPGPGEAVSLDGCGVGDVIVLRGVNFDFDKATLTVNAKSILDGVAAALQSRPDVEVELGGHTDGKGTESYNARLSERRARSVRDYLVSKGVAASRMTARGYGESAPVATNDTDDGRELNRRVELRVLRSAGGVTVAPPLPPAADASAPAAPSAATSGVQVLIKNFAFSPATLTVPVGTTVRWANEDGSTHFVKFADTGSEGLAKGATYERRFDAPGTYPYACSRHPTMTGTVVVQ